MASTTVIGISAAALLTSPASAGIRFIGGAGITVYGVANYGGASNVVAPTFIGNNVTGFNDVLTSPAGGFLTANPVVANNIAQFGGALPLASFKIGGGNANGFFGAGSVAITGPKAGFRLRDSNPGGGEASYEISSWTTNLLVTRGGFAGNFGTYLSVGGLLPAGGASADAVSLVSNYYVNNVYVGQTAPLVLAASGNCNFAAYGGSGAAVAFGPLCTSFRGLAIDNLAGAFAQGNVIKVVSTLTAYADPASIDGIAPDQDLINLTGTTLPTGILADVGGVPEPSTWALAILGASLVGWRMRARPARAAASA